MDAKQALRIIMAQISEVLDTLDNEKMSCPLSIFEGSSLGQHIRHIFDLKSCIINGQRNSLIDYSDRKRDQRLETDVVFAKDFLSHLTNEIDSIDLAKNVKVVQDFSSSFSEDRPIVISSNNRELMYAYDHAVHHLAIVKMGIRSAYPEIKLRKEIGVAPSTIRHQALKN